MNDSRPRLRQSHYYGLAFLAALSILALIWARYLDFIGVAQTLEQESAAIGELHAAAAECRRVLAIRDAPPAPSSAGEQTAHRSFSSLRLPPAPAVQDFLAHLPEYDAPDETSAEALARKLRAFDSLASLRRAQLLNDDALQSAAIAVAAAADSALVALGAYRRGQIKRLVKHRTARAGEFALYCLSLAFIVGLVVRRLQRETRKAESEQTYLQSLLDASAGMYIIRTDMQGNYTFGNRAFQEMFVPPEKRATFIGSPSMDYIIPEDHEITLRAVEECIAYGGAKPAKVTIRKPDIRGEIHISAWEFLAITNADGEITEIQCAGIDRTEERRIEARFRTAIEANLDAVYLLQCKRDEQSGAILDFIIREANVKATEQMATSRENLVGASICELFPVNRENGFFEQYKRVVEMQTPLEQEYSIPGDYDAPGWYYQQVVPMPESDGVAIFNRDIGDRKRAAQALEAKNRELEHYLYIASHDLRAPLVNIQGFSQRLERQAATIAHFVQNREEKPEDLGKERGEEMENNEKLIKIVCEDMPKALNFITLNVAKMDVLLASILQISRLGRTKINVQRLNMRALIQAVLESFTFQLEEAGARVHLADDIPECFGDAALLNQVFSNLIANAIKYRDAHKPLSIEITSHARRKSAVYLVRDNGIGIPEEFHHKIWDVFYRVDGRASAPGEGVGLSVVKTVVEKHFGSIGVQSHAGEGSVFWLELPTEPFTPL